MTCNLARVEVIRTWLQPKYKTLVCQSVDLINLINYYHSMNTFCADLVQPLTKLNDSITGDPKGAMLTHRNCVSNLSSIAFYAEVNIMYWR